MQNLVNLSLILSMESKMIFQKVAQVTYKLFPLIRQNIIKMKNYFT